MIHVRAQTVGYTFAIGIRCFTLLQLIWNYSGYEKPELSRISINNLTESK